MMRKPMSLLSRKHVYSGTTSKKNGVDKINDIFQNAHSEH